MLLPRAQGLPQPPGADQHLRQDGPQGASTSPSKTTLIMLIGTARPGHPRRDDRSRHIHPRRRQQDTLRGRVRRRSGVNQKPPPSWHLHTYSIRSGDFRHFTLQKGELCPHPHTHEAPLMASDSHCNIFVYVKRVWSFFFETGAGRASGRRSGFREGWFRWASRAWQRASAEQQAA